MIRRPPLPAWQQLERSDVKQYVCAVVSVNKQRLLYKNSAYYEPTIRLSLSLYMCTTGKGKMKDFSVSFAITSLLSKCVHIVGLLHS